MLNLKNSLRYSLLCSVVIFAIGGNAQAQAPQPLATPAPIGRLSAEESGALRELLNEVHLLRLVLQSTTAGGKRIQLAAERVRLQQERVDKAARDLDETRNQLADLKASQLRINEALKELERQARQEAFPVRRAELEKQYRLAKIELDPLAERDSRLRDRESQQLAFLAAEQSKLQELNEKLNALEREFDEQAAAEKSSAPERRRR
jgi:DNA repair exonuclease SbcCD ATPase subunit